MANSLFALYSMLWIVLKVGNLEAVSPIGRPHDDQITSLPGVNFRTNFEQYSGYLDAGEENYYHYWFFESQSDPSIARTQPLIVFFNGGPGCSSLVALFTECGPFRIKESGKTLVENPYAWNKISNVLFIESPAGTGFSYSNGAWNLSDGQSLQRHYTALLSFYDKFSEFRNRTIYLVGQSYASVYVSTLAQYIQQKKWNDFPGKLEGVILANGVYSLPLIINSRFYYNYYRALLGEDQYRHVIDQCCQGEPEGRCNLFPQYANPAANCSKLIQAALAVGEQGRDSFNINFECYKPSPEYKDDEECGVPFGNITTRYLDREDVRKAAHIDARFADYSFVACSDVVKANYTMQYQDLTEVFKSILDDQQHKVRILMMYGDADSVCNFLGAQWFMDGLNRTKLGERRPIYYNGISQRNVGSQQNYAGIDFLIIRGAGHYAPADRPRESLQILSNFLARQSDYSTPVIEVNSTAYPLTGGRVV